MLKIFHIDMNHAQFESKYLRMWLQQLASWGYEQILWEVEDNIQWETCPECVSPDAFSKKEFCEILNFSRNIGLEPIPLLQTLGHAEYVLKHKKYAHLRELPDNVEQYCPQNPEVISFLNIWIEEYLDIFGDVKYFHLGEDEAWALGRCSKCQKYAKKYSLAQLLSRHLTNISGPLIKRGIRPMIWSDMLLRKPDAIPKISRDIVICDWMYSISRRENKIWDWEHEKLINPDDLSSEAMLRFEKYLYPANDKSRPEIFYTSDYLKNMGFDVVGCSSSSSWYDNVFSPRLEFHLHNCFDWFVKAKQLNGFLLTSWTCHLFPWEMQMPCIELHAWLHENPTGSIEDYMLYWGKKHLGLDDIRLMNFYRACYNLSENGLFTYNVSLGMSKNAQSIPLDYVIDSIMKIDSHGMLRHELSATIKLLEKYSEAQDILKHIKPYVADESPFFDWWILAADNLVNRMKVVRFLLECQSGLRTENGDVLLEELKSLKIRTERAYSGIIKETRRKQMISWMYDSCQYGIEQWKCRFAFRTGFTLFFRKH